VKVMSRNKIKKVLRDLLRKYDLLSKRFDETVDRLSANQMVKEIDALTRLAKLILSYRGVLEIEERESELTKILSEMKRELESDKTALRAIKTRSNGLHHYLEEIAKFFEEIRDIKRVISGGGEN